ncbi:copper-binding protein [Salinigranum rubrum]|uniref:Copper-binding protein n=1 Tax=Salinigranum rubrum TaxID=755307 RepID=A0A2I8VKQ6_9EURY|nr:copper-binding protein [Salinigranum rubrum]
MKFRHTRRRAVKCVGAVLLGVTLAGCSGDGGNGGSDGDSGNGSGTTTVEMTDELVYDPEQVTVGEGDTVVWETVGAVGHSVTAYEDGIPEGAEYFASGEFDTEQAARDAYVPGDTDAGDVPSGESYEHTFDTAGTYEYFCIPHESSEMVGTVVVE